MVVLLRGNLIRTRCDSILLGSIQSSLESIVVCCSVDEELMVDGALSCGQVFKIHPQRLSSLMVASGCGPPQERSAIPFTFAGYGADKSVMRGRSPSRARCRVERRSSSASRPA